MFKSNSFREIEQHVVATRFIFEVQTQTSQNEFNFCKSSFWIALFIWSLSIFDKKEK